MQHSSLDTATSAQLRLAFTATNRAFTRHQPPELVIELLGEWNDQSPLRLEVQIHDLITGAVQRVEIPGGTTRNWCLRPDLPFGVFRATVEADGAIAAEGCFAYAPAARIADLPDDWPLAAHVTEHYPDPLPGFRWFRCFSHWSINHPAPDRFDWSQLDRFYGPIKAAGGRMMLADDGAPIWTSSHGKAGMEWLPPATAYPPDDLSHLQRYLAALRERYDDGSGTLASWEVWNEANTEQRFLGSPEQLVEITRVYRSEADRSSTPIQVVGMAVSAGPHDRYVQDLVAAGILDHVDAISAHFYEEFHSYERDTPLNNLPQHVELLKDALPGQDCGIQLINSEAGIDCVDRRDGRILTQPEIQREALAAPGLDRQRPWLIDGEWRRVSEFRGAGGFVAGIAYLASEGVIPTYTYHAQGWMLDDAPSLYWVAVSVFGDHLRRVDHRRCERLTASTEDPELRAIACRFGDPSGPNLTVAWAFRRDHAIGRSKLWQDWLDPVEISIAMPDSRPLTCHDLYGRQQTAIAVDNGAVRIHVGEEPCFLVG